MAIFKPLSSPETSEEYDLHAQPRYHNVLQPYTVKTHGMRHLYRACGSVRQPDYAVSVPIEFMNV